MHPSCFSVFLLVVEVPKYQWVPSYLWRISFCHIHITGIRTPTVMSRDASSGFTHHRSIGTNTLSLDRCPLDQMPCHTHGGLDTYNCLPVTVSSHYSILQMLLYIHASYYYRRPRAEMCLGLIELTWLVFPSLHTSKCYEIPQCVSTE